MDGWNESTDGMYGWNIQAFLLIFLLILFLVGCCYQGLRWYRCYTVLSRAGVQHGPAVPPFGDMFYVVAQREHVTDVLTRTYESFPGDRLVGRYEFLTPFFLVRDPELLKRITVKDFEHFVDRSVFIDPEAEPLFGRILVTLTGDEWKDMRSALSPMFTSSKIRQMIPFMMQAGNQMMEAIRTKIEQSTENYVDLEAKDLTTRYANDVIATCAFGLEINSQQSDNEFYNMCKELTTGSSFSSKMRFFGYSMVPWLMKWLKLSLLSPKIRDFFSNVVLGAMKQREEMNIHRPDMIQLLMDLKKGKLTHETKTTKDELEHAEFAAVEESLISRSRKTAWSDMDLVAQAVIFLFAGYDTISSTMSFLLYELAVNPECQEKLVREIRENEMKNKGQFDYSSVQQMTYLDMVVSEVIRKWPGSPSVDRLCVRDYNLGKANNNATKDVIIRKGQSVQLPLWAYQRDPNYFPNPDKFDPERFSEENKHNINPFVYMPFGLGPRNCIASRFALCEVKVMAYQFLQLMEVSPCEKTRIPLRMSPKDGFRMAVEGGNWLRFRPRQGIN